MKLEKKSCDSVSDDSFPSNNGDLGPHTKAIGDRVTRVDDDKEQGNDPRTALPP
jgi:hypothetical protein